MTPFYKRSFLKIAAAGDLSLFSSSLLAQSDPTGERRVTGTFAITNATVASSPGSVSKGTSIIKNGLRVIVGDNPSIPLAAQVLEGESLFACAGFLGVASDAGVSARALPERPSSCDPSDPAPLHAVITPQHYRLNH